MGRILYLLVVVMLVTGCSTVPDCKPVEVQIPIRVPCVQSVPDKPDYEVERLMSQSTDFEKIQALTIDYMQQKQYINELEAVIDGCR